MGRSEPSTGSNSMMAADGPLVRRGTAYDPKVFRGLLHRASSIAAVVASLVIFSTLARGVAADESEPVLTIDPHRLTVEIGTDDNTVNCKFEDSADPQAAYRYLWVDSNGNPLDNTSSVYPRITYNETTGVLTLLDAQENDTDVYTCYVLDHLNCTYNGDENYLANCTSGTFKYKVYVMPDYTTDGIIIGAINGGLLLIFVACLIRSAVADRRRLRKYGQKL